MVHHLWGLLTAGHRHPLFGVLFLAMISPVYSCPQAHAVEQQRHWQDDTVGLKLIRHKDGSIVSISKISDLIMSICSSLMLWNLQLYNNSFEWKNVTFSGVWPLLHIFGGGEVMTPNPQDLRPWERGVYLGVSHCSQRFPLHRTSFLLASETNTHTVPQAQLPPLWLLSAFYHRFTV